MVALVAYAVQAIVLVGAFLASGASASLPVLAVFGTPVEGVETWISTIDLAWALVVILVGGALTHTLVVLRPAPSPTVLVAAWSQGAAIVVFLVAQLNGITALTSLVALYALTAGTVALMGIDTPEQAVWGRPAAWAAAIGIVPWGIIAFAQIGSTIVLGEPSIAVRILTLIALAVAITGWVIGWRRQGAPRPVDVVTMTAGVSLALWAIAVPMLVGTLG